MHDVQLAVVGDLRERLRVSETELLSIYRVLQSQFDLSLRAAFSPKGEVPPAG